MDSLERAAVKLQEQTGLKSNATDDEIKAAFKYNEKLIHSEKM